MGRAGHTRLGLDEIANERLVVRRRTRVRLGVLEPVGPVGGVVAQLRRCGIKAEEEDDGLVIYPGTPHAAAIDPYDDHRMAMAFALFGLVTDGIEITNPGCVAKTFPDYFTALAEARRNST